MLKTETRSIGDLEVTVTQLPVMRATPLMAKIAKAIAPALNRLELGALGSSLATSNVDALVPAFGEMLTRLDEVELMAIARGVLASAVVVTDGKRLSLNSDEMINLAFEGRGAAFLQTIRFALEVNFSDFFAGALAETAKRRAATVAAARPPEKANAST